MKRIAIETLRENPAVLGDPPPMVIVDSLGDSSVMMRLYGWIDQAEHDFIKSKSESIRLVKEAFDDAGIEMPEPIYRIHLRDGIAPTAETTAAKAPKPATGNKSVGQTDLSPDDTIDNQIKAEADKSEENNLLDEKEPTASRP